MKTLFGIYMNRGVEIRHARGWLNPRHEDYYKCRGSLLLLAARGGHEALVSFFMGHLLRRIMSIFRPRAKDGRR